jgi:hypothetical protein
MPTTYSISQGVTYAELLPNFQSVLNVLPDNTQKLIAPRDVRDSFFTTWESIVFKKTKLSSSGNEYIGIDDINLTQKVYFGKKLVGGVEVLNDDLLSNDTDFYFYNNKAEPQFNYSTKIAILAGTIDNFNYEGGDTTTPYLESRVVDTAFGTYLNFEIRNKSYIYDGTDRFGGDINLFSDKGHVSINGLIFQKYIDTAKADNDGKYLKFVWDGISAGYATWSTIEIPNQPDPVDPANIFFTDSTPTPQALGGIPALSTFDNVPVTEMFRKLLYPYLKPSVSADYSVSVIESGDTVTAASQQFNYTIKRPGTYSITGRTLTPSDLQFGSPPLFDPTTVTSAGLSGNVKPSFNIFLPSTSVNSSVSNTLKITDANNTEVEDSGSFNIVLPWYYGVSTTVTNTVAGINNLLGTTTPVANKLTAVLKTSASATTVTLTTVGLGGQGCVYFGYPSIYPDLKSITDGNLFEYLNVSSPDYAKYTLTGIKSPLGRWGSNNENREYKFYIFTQGTGTPTTTTIGGLAKYTFSFTI